jgi:cytochrome c oxidase assembly protein subunit 15
MRDAQQEPSGTPERPRARRWSARLAAAAFCSALPLVLFGGSVTTLGAGMAVEGWLVAEGHFLLFFPVEEWFRDLATFVEHTHRLFGVLTGLCALAGCLLGWLSGSRPARWLSSAALLAVVSQGVLGGLRVLEADARLAFLHGALAQAVLALLAASALVQGRAWSSWRPAARAAAGAPGVRLPALAAVAVVYLQVVLGACYRHALRPLPGELSPLLFLLHALTAVLVVAVLVVAAEGLRRARHAAPDALPAALCAAPGRTYALLLLQVALGFLAWLGGQHAQGGAVGPLEWLLSVAHVLVGGLLLALCLATALWTWRAFPRGPRGRASVGQRLSIEVAP